MIIRKAKAKDVDEVYKVFMDLFKVEDKGIKDVDRKFLRMRKRRKDFVKSAKKELLREFRERCSIYLVAEIDGKIAGYAYGSVKKEKNPFFDMPVVGHANALVVLKKFRRKGVAKALVKEREKWFRKKKCEFISLSVASTNPAVGFHEKQGYKTVVYNMVKGFK